MGRVHKSWQEYLWAESVGNGIIPYFRAASVRANKLRQLPNRIQLLFIRI